MTEGYGNLFEYLLADPSWARPTLDVAYPADYRRLALFERLYLLRRHATWLLYERALYAGDDYEALGQSYAELFTRTLGVEHAPEPYLAELNRPVRGDTPAGWGVRGAASPVPTERV